MGVDDQILAKYQTQAPREVLLRLLQSLSREERERVLASSTYFQKALAEFQLRTGGSGSANKSVLSSSSNKSPRTLSPNHRLPPPPPTMVGLHNIGNTCYFNSLLQSLFAIAPFREAILDLTIPEARAGLSSRTLHAWDLLVALKALFFQMDRPSAPSLNPSQVINSVYNELDEKVVIGEQQDMVEYLMIFLEQIGHGVRHIIHPELAAAEEKKLAGGPPTPARPPRESLTPSTTPRTKGELSGMNEPSNATHVSQLNSNQSVIAGHATSSAARTFVDELFKGQLAWALEAKEKDAPVQKDNLEDFGPLIVDIADKSLPDALAAKLRYSLDDFRPEVD